MRFFSRLFGKRFDYTGVTTSPNGRIKLEFILKKGDIYYRAERDGKMLVRESRLGFELKDARPLKHDFYFIRAHAQSFDGKWETIVGEQREIRNNYNETAFYLVENNAAGRLLTLRFRAYDDGVAFRYELPVADKFREATITDELTEFYVDINSSVWKIPAYQPDRYEYNYEKQLVHEITGSVHTPLTIGTTSGAFISIHEAALYNYGSMTVKLNGRALKSDITPLSDGTRAHVMLPFSTPWRVILMGSTENDLVANRMVLNLNDPPRGDFSWVKPLKFLGIWWAMFVGEWTWAPGERHGATTEHAREYIDDCVRLGIPGLLVEGWNDGWEGDWLLNGEHNKFMESYPDFDLDRVAQYAHENNVEIVSHHETVGFVDNYVAQLPAAYEYLKERDIKYVKTGYAGSMMTIDGRREYHHSQVGVLHYQWTVELAAKYGICLNIHEPIKGTGIERTWPNLLTREGARGQEYEGGALSPSHACYLPYTRLLAGGMDYTSGIFDITNYTKRVASTLVRQLAYFVTIFSGMQMAADRPRFYIERMDAFKFIHDVPLNWDLSVPLLGKIGEYFLIARKDRDSENWYIGGVTNEEGRRVHVNLEFLDTDAEYEAEIYRDGEGAHFRDNPLDMWVQKRSVTRADVLDVYMAPGGGVAMRLVKRLK